MGNMGWLLLCGFLAIHALGGCAPTEQQRPQLRPSTKLMSSAQLAKYNDSFDKLRDDLYEIAAMAWTEEQMDNLCLGDTEVTDGRLKIQTKPGCLSRGGLGSRYEFKGDFDVQIDCHVRFLKGIQEMDQIVLFLFTGKGSLKDFPVAGIQLAQFAGSPEARISSIYKDQRKYRSPGSWKIGDFTGTLRITKVRDRVTTLYKRFGEPEWTKLSTEPFDENSLRLWFVVRNFTPKTTSVKGSSSIVVTFDDLVINAAEEIIEGEI